MYRQSVADLCRLVPVEKSISRPMIRQRHLLASGAYPGVNGPDFCKGLSDKRMPRRLDEGRRDRGCWRRLNWGCHY